MKFKLMLAAFLMVALSIVCAVTIYTSNYEPAGDIVYGRKNIPILNTSLPEPAQLPVVFENAATAAVPSVVHIRTVINRRQEAYQEQMQQSPFGNMPDDNSEGYGGQPQQPAQMASGSGVIIGADGYIVTNNHVVDGASEIMVTLNNRRNYPATLVGTDPNSDLAVLKIEAANLPVIAIGNSDQVKLGQGVLAIGYPLNLEVTVTQGIVSAKSRNIGINRQGPSPVEAFIQTDAAVNPGSSGGALVNIKGELVGINAAIASPTGSFAGYAYAIPSNLMKKVTDDIMKYGAVQRGYLGIRLAPENSDETGNTGSAILDDVNGVRVMDVDPSGAAQEAGIQKGDIIRKVNDTRVNTGTQLIEQIAEQAPGNKIAITVVRGGEEKTMTVQIKQ